MVGPFKVSSGQFPFHCSLGVSTRKARLAGVLHPVVDIVANQGRVLTRQNLLDKLWKYDFYGDERVVDTHIKNLRKKLGIDFIQTIRGVGYKIDKEN